MSRTFQLTAETQGAPGRWSLEIDDARFVLKDPRGTVAVDAALGTVHRLIDLVELEVDLKLSLPVGGQPVTFKSDRALARLLNEQIDRALRDDAAFREERKAHAAKRVPTGIGLFGVGGSLFAGYCWVLAVFDKTHANPPGWIQALGGLIHVLGLVLLGCALAGFYMVASAALLKRRIDRAERRREVPSLPDKP